MKRLVATLAFGVWLTGAAAAQAVSGSASGQTVRSPAPTSVAPESSRLPPAPRPAAPDVFRPTAPLRPAAVDLFRANPETYAPRYDRLTRLPWHPHALMPGGVVAGYSVVPSASGLPTDTRDQQAIVLVFTTPPAPVVTSVASAPVVSPAPPARLRTPFYVIRNCYVGDSPPRADDLPPGCTLTNLRRIEPQ